MSMRTDKHIAEELQAAQQAYHSAATNGKDGSQYAAEMKTLRAELASYITDGAEACPDCGNLPHGIRQQAGVNRLVITYYEVGCLTCKDHRAQGQTREEAVENWNEGKYLPAK
jgi:hypothetical protein